MTRLISLLVPGWPRLATTVVTQPSLFTLSYTHYNEQTRTISYAPSGPSTATAAKTIRRASRTPINQCPAASTRAKRSYARSRGIPQPARSAISSPVPLPAPPASTTVSGTKAIYAGYGTSAIHGSVDAVPQINRDRPISPIRASRSPLGGVVGIVQAVPAHVVPLG